MEEEKNVEKVSVNEEEPKNEKNNEEMEQPVITSRVLFVSVLDKLFLILASLGLVGAIVANFNGNMSSLSYGYWERVFESVGIFLIFLLVLLVLNFFYKCIAKTMLCLTEKQVYQEIYLPFFEKKVTIPLEKITKVSTCNFLWIFRCIIIHQYMQLPLVFFTWNNKEFKEKLLEKLHIGSKQVENEWKNKNIMTMKQIKILAIVCIAIIILAGIAALIGNLTCIERKIVGYYENEEYWVRLNVDGTCSVNNLGDEDGENYTWHYDKNDEEIIINYRTREYGYYSGYYYDYDSLDFKFNAELETLQYGGGLVLRKTKSK